MAEPFQVGGDVVQLTWFAVKDRYSHCSQLFNLSAGATGALVDARFPPQIRFIHASANFGDADIYLDDLDENPMATPIVTNHMHTDITPYFDVAGGDQPITYTPPGDTGSTLINVDEVIFQGTRNDFIVYRNLNDVDSRSLQIPDRRSVSTNARFSIINTDGGGGRESVDFYIIPAGELLDDFVPILPNFPRSSTSIRLPIIPDAYDIYITAPGDTAMILAGPIAWTPDFGDVVDTIIFENAADPNVVDLVFMPQP